jgi:hypothetical protein
MAAPRRLRNRFRRAAGSQARHGPADQFRQRLGQTILLGEGRGAALTGALFQPSGHSIQAQGIIPDIQVAQATRPMPCWRGLGADLVAIHRRGSPPKVPRSSLL